MQKFQSHHDSIINQSPIFLVTSNCKFQSHHDSIINWIMIKPYLREWEFQSHHDSIINPVESRTQTTICVRFNPTMIRL